jgi:disulfide bond formation protein DsbB
LNPKLIGQARLLKLICLASLAAVGVALLGQHVFDVRPCPWCVLQRLEFLLLAFVTGLGWAMYKFRAARLAAFALALALALSGIATAYYQHEVASLTASCAMTFADRVLGFFGLEAAVPPLFMVTASCSEAAHYRMLGLPYEILSGVLFVGVLLLAVNGLRKA